MELKDLKTLSKQTSLSVFTLRKFARTGMPHLKVGRKILVDRENFESWFVDKFRVDDSAAGQAPDLGAILDNARKALG